MAKEVRHANAIAGKIHEDEYEATSEHICDGGAADDLLVVQADETLQGKPVNTAIASHIAEYGLHTKVVRKVSDETVNNSSAFQNDDELFFAIAANEVWLFHCFITQISGTTPDLKVQWTGPGGSTVIFHYQDIYGQGWYTDTVVGAGANRPVSMFGLIINGATLGNCQFQWAQKVANASDTKVLADSCIVATRIA